MQISRSKLSKKGVEYPQRYLSLKALLSGEKGQVRLIVDEVDTVLGAWSGKELRELEKGSTKRIYHRVTPRIRPHCLGDDDDPVVDY